MNPLKAFFDILDHQSPKQKMDISTIYEIPIKSLNGDPIQLSQYKGKYILFVNVASKCGFTPQYKSLQELHETFGNKLQVIGVPCNQFGGQEPGDADAIKSFCEVNYGVDFLITEKVDVKGKNQHPLYTWLTQKENNGVKNSTINWNFQKYLVDSNGQLVDYYLSLTNPMSSKIIKYLK